MTKKIILVVTLFTVFALLSFTSAEAAYQIKGGTKTKKLPRGTKIELKMSDPITTADVSVGENFNSTVTQDVEAQGSIILPKGTVVRGNVSQILPAKRLSKAAILYLTFDHIVTPTGRQLPIKAGICSHFKLTDDGAVTEGGNWGFAVAQNWHKAIDITKKSTLWGIASGDNLFDGGRFLVTPFSVAGGAVAGGFYFIGDSIIDLFRKGNEVVINQGKTFNILILEDIDVPAW